MTHRWVVIAASAIVLASGCSAQHPRSPTLPAGGCPDGLHEAVGAWEDVGFSGVVVIMGPVGECTVGAGLRDRESGAAMAADTVFAIGSVSKSFTAAAILQLVADGRLTLDTPAGAVVSGLAGPAAEATIEQLLTHTSGLLGDAGPDHQSLTRDEAITAISKLPRSFTPGTDFGYTNAGYTLLALVIDTIAGDYREYIVDRVARSDDTGSKAGFWDGEPAAQGPRAVGYLESGRSNVLGQFQGPHWSTSGNGDLAMSVPTLAAWSLDLFAGALLPESATAALTTPRWDHGDGTSETFGWVRYDETVFGHVGFVSAGGGGDTGHNSIVAVIPELDTAVAIASNTGDVTAGQLMQQLAPALISGDQIPFPNAQSGSAADPGSLTSASGIYRFDDGSELDVRAEGAKRVVTAHGELAIDTLFSLPAEFTPSDVLEHEAAVVDLLTGDDPIGADERKALRRAVGEIQNVIVLGTVAEHGELRTYVTVVGTNATLDIWYSLADSGAVGAAQGPTDPPSATFTGRADGAFVNTDPTGRRADVTLRFGARSVTVDNGSTTAVAQKTS